MHPIVLAGRRYSTQLDEAKRLIREEGQTDAGKKLLTKAVAEARAAGFLPAQTRYPTLGEMMLVSLYHRTEDTGEEYAELAAYIRREYPRYGLHNADWFVKRQIKAGAQMRNRIDWRQPTTKAVER